MSEQTIINQTKNPLNKSALIAHFKKAGIKNTDTVLVHTALSKLGFIIGGAQTVLEALLETLNEGTLVMPTHTADLSDPKHWQHPPVPKAWHDDIRTHMPLFNQETTPTRGMGKVAQQFLCLKKTVRSFHPQVSFSAYGKNAAYLTKDHPLTPMFGMESPLGKLYQHGAKILMLGAPLSTCTAFHLSEILSASVAKFTDGIPAIEDGKKVFKYFEDYDYDDDDFENIGQALIKNDIIQVLSIGLSKSYLMDAKCAIDAAATWMKKARQS